MLAGELRFYKNGKIIKTIDSEEYDKLNAEALKAFVDNLVGDLAADKVIENCIYHNSHSGVNTAIFLAEG